MISLGAGEVADEPKDELFAVFVRTEAVPVSGKFFWKLILGHDIFFLLGLEERASFFFFVKMGLDDLFKVSNGVEEDDGIGNVDPFDVFDLRRESEDFFYLFVGEVVDAKDHNSV